MANRVLRNPGVGSISPIGEVNTVDGKITEKALAEILGSINSLISAYNGGVSFGTGENSTRVGNFAAGYITWVFSSVANTEEEIPHGLGRIPIGLIPVAKDRACDVYISSFGSWNPDRFFLKCSVASAAVNLLVF